MIIRILTFEGCASCEATRRLVEETVNELHVQAEIDSVRVDGEDEARRQGFLGSPTIQVDGQDIEASRRGGKATFACRLYRTPNGVNSVPPRSLLAAAIREAQLGEATRNSH
jgi:glutaredoxin